MVILGFLLFAAYPLSYALIARLFVFLYEAGVPEAFLERASKPLTAIYSPLEMLPNPLKVPLDHWDDIWLTEYEIVEE